MTVQAVYKGFTINLRNAPGYTSGLSVASQTTSGTGSPPAQSQPDDRHIEGRSTFQHEHVQNHSDWHALGNFEHSLLTRITPVQHIMVAQKISESLLNRTVEADSAEKTNEFLPVASASESDDLLNIQKDKALIDDRMWVQTPEIKMHADKELYGKNSLTSSDFGASGGASRTMDGSVGRNGWLAARGLGTASGGGKSVLGDDFGLHKNPEDVNQAENGRSYIYNSSSPGTIGPGNSPASFEINQDQRIGLSGVLNPVARRIPLVGDALEKTRIESTDVVAGTVLVHPSIKDGGAGLVEKAKVALREGYTSFSDESFLPKKDFKAFDVFVPKPDAAEKAKLQNDYVRAKMAASSEALVNALNSKTGGSPETRAMMSYEASPFRLQIESRDAFSLKTPPQPAFIDNQFLYLQSKSPVEADIEQKTVVASMPAGAAEFRTRILERGDHVAAVRRNSAETAVGTERSYYSPEIPPEKIRANVAADNPYDYRSHFERVVVAEKVPDEARNFSRTRHDDLEIHNIKKAAHDEKTKKIMENQLFARNDPRIQEVVETKERVDVFALYEAVQVEGKGKDGSPTYNNYADATQYLTRSGLSGSLALNWAGKDSRS